MLNIIPFGCHLATVNFLGAAEFVLTWSSWLTPVAFPGGLDWRTVPKEKGRIVGPKGLKGNGFSLGFSKLRTAKATLRNH